MPVFEKNVRVLGRLGSGVRAIGNFRIFALSEILVNCSNQLLTQDRCFRCTGAAVLRLPRCRRSALLRRDHVLGPTADCRSRQRQEEVARDKSDQVVAQLALTVYSLHHSHDTFAVCAAV